MKTAIVTILFCVIGLSCDSVEPSNPYFVTLENQIEHSGIKIELVESGAFTITDGNGGFNLDNFENGFFNMVIKYPYFIADTVNVEISGGEILEWSNVELKQIFVFDFDHDELITTAVTYHDRLVYGLPLINLRVRNLTNKDFLLITDGSIPTIIWAIVPQDLSIAHSDVSWDCLFPNGTLYNPGTDIILPRGFLAPAQETVEKIIETGSIDAHCFPPGEYYFFGGLNLVDDFPEYFKPGYLGDGMTAEMNESLYKKKNLFNPIKLIFNN